MRQNRQWRVNSNEAVNADVREMSAMLRRAALGLWARAYLLSEAEPALFRRLPSLLPQLAPGWPVARTIGIDVGASMGVYTLALAAWCEKVIALEPNPAMAEGLRKAEIARVEVIEAAASNATGEGVLTDARRAGRRRPEAKIGGDGAWTTACRLMRLDRIAAEPEALVAKIDVEGYEGAVLEGMGALLDCPFVFLLVEIEERHNPGFGAIFETLAARGFEALRWNRARLVPATANDVPRAETFRGGRFARLMGYRPNFVFLKVPRR